MRWMALALVILACAAIAVMTLVRHSVRGTVGTELVYDDFVFQVLGTETRDSLLDGRLHPEGVYRLVRLRILNDAVRVDYRMPSHRAVLVGSDGERYEVDREAQRTLDAALPADKVPPAVLHPGDETVTELVYDVPRGEPLELMISWGGSAIDLLDWIFCGERRIVLP